MGLFLKVTEKALLTRRKGLDSWQPAAVGFFGIHHNLQICGFSQRNSALRLLPITVRNTIIKSNTEGKGFFDLHISRGSPDRNFRQNPGGRNGSSDGRSATPNSLLSLLLSTWISVRRNLTEDILSLGKVSILY